MSIFSWCGGGVEGWYCLGSKLFSSRVAPFEAGIPQRIPSREANAVLLRLSPL